MRLLFPILAAMALGLGACASSPDRAGAADPPTAGPLDIGQVYQGVWHEQARTPTSLTRGCEYATTTYGRDARGRITVRDACLQGGPQGRERAIEGTGEVQDPGENAVLRVRYRFGPFSPTRTYRIIAVGDGRDWFVSAEPGFERVYVFSRAVSLPAAELDRVTSRVRVLGYRGDLEVLANAGE